MKNSFITALFIFLLGACQSLKVANRSDSTLFPINTLNYEGTPISPEDRSSLAFSDQGAWFAYGFCDTKSKTLGFSGPFLMTQGHGEWSSESLSRLKLIESQSKEELNLAKFNSTQVSYNSHLHQTLESKALKIEQNLVFSSPHSAVIFTEITNLSKEAITLNPSWSGSLFSTGIQLTNLSDKISLTTDRSEASGIIQAFGNDIETIQSTDSSYSIALKTIRIKPEKTATLTLTHTFIFPEYDSIFEQENLGEIALSPRKILNARIKEKTNQLNDLYAKLDTNWSENQYKELVAKTLLTLQNNSRIPAGELHHAGIFPSYHYKWFLGFWAWDSWKHSVAVANYDADLAKDQIRAMYDFQLENGFIVDCIYRDTMIERHNYRNTKPPLSAWAVWKVFQQDRDLKFIKEMYPKLVKQHNWWYAYRDFDRDSICEYGSTDGTLVAAKWESGMDNAVRFDQSQMVKSTETVYSLNQESVDLNAYLYAEKVYLLGMAKILGKLEDVRLYQTQAKSLKTKIQQQFYNEKMGWFYDTSIDGKGFIEVMGCEGWIPLWANVATDKQANAVKENMMNPHFFNTKVPFQTLSASHSEFNPDNGYWRGPNWLDQAYFGVIGLRNYGYFDEANQATYKLIHNADGVLKKGAPIRENYQPISGQGLESKNFSWSAAHYLLLLLRK